MKEGNRFVSPHQIQQTKDEEKKTNLGLLSPLQQSDVVISGEASCASVSKEEVRVT